MQPTKVEHFQATEHRLDFFASQPWSRRRLEKDHPRCKGKTLLQIAHRHDATDAQRVKHTFRLCKGIATAKLRNARDGLGSHRLCADKAIRRSILLDRFQQSLAGIEFRLVLLGLLDAGFVLLHGLGFFVRELCFGTKLLFFRIGTTGDQYRYNTCQNHHSANTFHKFSLLLAQNIERTT